MYLNTNAEARIHLIYQAQVVASGEAAFGAIHAPGFDPRSAVVLDTLVVVNAAAPAPNLDGHGALLAGERNLYYTAYAPEEFAVVAVTPAPAYLVLAEVWYPGWRAWLDGIEVPIYRADFAFRAVYLPAPGEHTLVMRFDPWLWKAGLAVTGLTLLLAAWAGAFAWRRRGQVRP